MKYQDFNINTEFLKENGMNEYEEVFIYLEELRQSGETNMFGAIPYILDQFPELNEREAKNILSFYMKNYTSIYEF